MPEMPDFLELFLILVVYHGITDDAGKVMEKKRHGKKKSFNERFINAQQMKLHQECDPLQCYTTRYISLFT